MYAYVLQVISSGFPTKIAYVFLFFLYLLHAPPMLSFDHPIIWGEPVTVTERSKACTVFARSEAGLVGSNPIPAMDV
jgi:hypothetical protein